jgi:excisionase family DNA binding protein
MTVPEAAEALAISRSKLYELLASGAIASIRIDGAPPGNHTGWQFRLATTAARRTAWSQG